MSRVILTQDEYLERMDTLANNYDLVRLESLTVANLRELAKGLFPMSSLKKCELVAKLWDVVKESKARKFLEETKEIVEMLESPTESVIAVEEREYAKANGIVTSIFPEARAIYDTLKSLVADLTRGVVDKDGVIGRIEDEADMLWYRQSRFYEKSTVKGNNSTLRKLLWKELGAESETVQKELSPYVALFLEKYYRKVGVLVKELKVEECKRIAERHSDIMDWDAAKIVDFVSETLDNLDSKTWQEIALAIGFSTGRRFGEILSTARFETTDDTHSLMFYGQLKDDKVKFGKDGKPLKNIGEVVAEKSLALETKGYKIPVLWAPTKIIAAHQKLRDLGVITEYVVGRESQPYASKNKAFSRWFVKNEGLDLGVRYFKDSRTAYGNLVWLVYEKHCRKVLRKTKQSFLSKVLGHSEYDIVSANSYDVVDFVNEEAVLSLMEGVNLTNAYTP